MARGRWRWKRRSTRIWFYDVSKQGFSSGLQHGANIVFALILTKGTDASECANYFVMYTITSIAAIGVVVVVCSD